MNYFLDIAAAAVIAVCIITGAKKGAARMIISAVGWAAAFAAAVFVSGAFDEYVYDKFVKPPVISALEKKAEELSESLFSEDNIEKFFAENGIGSGEEAAFELPEDKDKLAEVLTYDGFSDKLNSVFINYCRGLTEVFSDILPDDVIDNAESYIGEHDIRPERKLELLAKDRKSAAEFVESKIVRPVILKIVRTIMFAVTFTVVSAAFAVISYIVRAVRGISAVRSADDILGGLLGIFQGLVITALICVISDIYIDLTSDGSAYLNSAVISETMIFKWLYGGTLFLLSMILK